MKLDRRLELALAAAMPVSAVAGAVITGSGSSQSPYVVPSRPGVVTVSLLTAGVQREHGGTITCLLDGTEAGNMFDNMTITPRGLIFLQEEVGDPPHNGKLWRYSIKRGTLELVAHGLGTGTPMVREQGSAPRSADFPACGFGRLSSRPSLLFTHF